MGDVIKGNFPKKKESYPMKYEVWFRNSPDSQANYVMENVHSVYRAEQIADEGIKKHKYGKVADIIGYDENGERVFDKQIKG